MWVIVGAGAVGQAITLRLHKLGESVLLIHRPYQKPSVPVQTASSWEAAPWEKVKAGFLCTKDSQIAATAQALQAFWPVGAPLYHTAGSVSLDLLRALYPQQAGVIYPLYSFTVGQPVPWGEFPIFWEGVPTAEAHACLLSGTAEKVFAASSEERLRLHIGAVFTANFLNALFHAADRVAQPVGSWRTFLPLAQQVLEKLKRLPPEIAQTGPAVRRDTLTLEKHLSTLQQEYPPLAVLYQTFTEYIQKAIAQSSRQ